MSLYPNRGPGGEQGGTPQNPAEPEGKPAQRRRWSIRIATVAGIPIRLNFTFLLVVIWLALADLGMGSLTVLATVFGVFFCVALHELGHSLVARRYGYPVRDITLYPIGGVAVIEGNPTPRHELAIAIAGPAVNVAIALLVALGLTVWGQPPTWSQIFGGPITNPLLLLLQVNLVLAIFNLIPALPMDGGRILRALLGLSGNHLRATRVAARVGQVIAFLMALWGLGVFGNTGSLTLVLIALFVFFGAGQEVQAEETRATVEDSRVAEAMLREFQTLRPGDTLREAADALLATSQQDFPVLQGSEVAGLLSRSQLLQAIARNGDSAYVAGAMNRNVLIARPQDRLEDYVLRADGIRDAPVLVLDDGNQLVGMLTLENLAEYMTLREITRSREA